MFQRIETHFMEVEKPGRYIGNEVGIPKKDYLGAEIKMVISYPDVYEIGMSNYGIKILYDRVNKLDFAVCERVFSPWTDFERLLQELNEPLYSLESKTALNRFDVVGVSIQYELLFSNFLALLKSGQISLKREERREDEPIVVIGGPGAVNPFPYAPFIDLSCVGEGEELLVELLTELRELKRSGAVRKEILKELSKIEGVYSPDFTDRKVKRRVYMGFSEDTGPDNVLVPNIDIVQNKLVVEIMRGCPNKCRFCQAGIIYKPFREKDTATILQAVRKGLKLSGMNEVTFSSLSSGDYSHILSLSEYFNKEYKKYGISVSLPSLKVESFDTDILDRISEVRKSGLTFAVESGSREGQLSLNKIVDLEKIFQILDAATAKGWRLVKFYFMIGLPEEEDDVGQIKKFIDAVLFRYKKLQINLNIATFVPKPHTPYQDDRQLSYGESLEKIREIREYYRRSRVLVKAHEPEMSYIEGFISRGDERVGRAVLKAFERGARFDGWKDQFHFQTYLKAFEEDGITYQEYLAGERSFVWQKIDCLPGENFYRKEKEKSKAHQKSVLCKEGCDPECHICTKEIRKVVAQDDYLLSVADSGKEMEKEGKSRYFLEFTKSGLMKYLSHKDLMRYFETLFRIGEIRLKMSEGFNPHPKFQFCGALSLGLVSFCELLEFYTEIDYPEEELFRRLSRCERDEIQIKRIRRCESSKKLSLYDHLFMTEYFLPLKEEEYPDVFAAVEHFCKEKTFLLEDERGKYDLKTFVIPGEFQEKEGWQFFVKRLSPGPKLKLILSRLLPEKSVTQLQKVNMFCDEKGTPLFYLDD